jgi:hypothetical protein
MRFLKHHVLLLLLLSFVLIQSSFAQKKRILVVLYDRFQFASQYSLEEIAKVNEVEQSAVFLEYQKNITEAFTTFSNDNFEFVSLPSITYLSLRKQTKYQLEKFDGKKYNATNLSLLSFESFQEILQQNQADFILFVNWYSIEKNVHTAYVGDNNKRFPFSLHKIDYDVYNQQKQKVVGKGNVKLQCGQFPSAEMVQEKSLKATSLKGCYADLINELLKELSATKNQNN